MEGSLLSCGGAHVHVALVTYPFRSTSAPSFVFGVFTLPHSHISKHTDESYVSLLDF